jgi:hypothetical protein
MQSDFGLRRNHFRYWIPTCGDGSLSREDENGSDLTPSQFP